jgi:MYXO-CTERM domain-containing protein
MQFLRRTTVGRSAATCALVGLVGLALQGGGCGRSNDVIAGAGGAVSTTVGVGGSAGGGPPPEILNFPPCAEVHEEATLVPVNMYLTVDKSGSMADTPMGGTMPKWDQAKAAFKAFFADPSAASLDLALRLWPLSTDGCNDTACDAMACATPQVPLGSLGDMAQQQALGAALDAVQPQDATPMSAALDGARLWAEAQLMAVPDEQVVIVMVTDGEPHGCDENVDNIAAIAAQAFAAGVPVYVVAFEGVGMATIEQLAMAGGSQTGYYLGGANGEAELLAAMQDIQGKSVQCSFPFPEEMPGAELTPDLMRIEYTSGTDTIIVHRVEGAADCGPDGGWYFDDPVTPTTITLCPSTCATVQGDVEAKVDIAVGCECVVDTDCPEGNVCEDHHCVPPCMTDADCPAGKICYEGHCIPKPGDPCAINEDCPPPLVCVGEQCALEGNVLVGREEAVQGGAFNCQISVRPSPTFLGLFALLGGAGLAFARRRRT